jgi:DNA primase
MKYENLEFKEALQILADRAGVKLPAYSAGDNEQDKAQDSAYRVNELSAKFYHEVLMRSESVESARQYAKSRGLKAETVNEWLIGYAPEGFHTLETFLLKKGFTKKELSDAGVSIVSQRNSSEIFDRFSGRLMFPIWNMSGKIIGFTARILTPDAKAAKYVNSPETVIYHKSRVIFGLYQARQAIRKKDEAIIVEGNMDVITCHQAGFTNVIGSSGTAFTTEQLGAIGRFTKNLKFAFDTDQAGILAAKRALDSALELGMNVSIVKIDGAKDPDELIQKDPELFAKAIAEAPRYMDYFFERAFSGIDRTSVQQKKQASEMLVPLIAKMGDKLEAAHYIKRLGTELDLPEKTAYEIIADEQAKQKPLQQRSSTTTPAVVKQLIQHNPVSNRTRSLEQRIAGYALLQVENSKYHSMVKKEVNADELSIPEFRELFELGVSKKQVSSTLQDAVNMALFVVESELELSGSQQFEKDLKRTLKEFKANAARSKLAELAGAIAQADREKDRPKLAELNQQFAEASAILKENES